jgi:Fe-S cluster biogenesis protein NfuA
MFIQTEETPNPETLKFLPGRTVMKNGTADFPNRESAWRSMLTKKLFEFAGVQSVFLGADFISITKSDEANWLTLKPSLLTTIMEYFLTHDAVDLDTVESQPSSGQEDNEIIQEIKELLETRIRPAVAQDGGDIVFERFEDGIVYVQLQGACSGCPSSSATLKAGIENMLRHYIPEVEEVRAI